MSDHPLRILTVANVDPDPNSGAAGTVFHTNEALRALGHEVTEIWRGDLGGPVIRHGNLFSLLEQPVRYSRAVSRFCGKGAYDVVQISQPQAWRAFQGLRKAGFRGLLVNRSHGVELVAKASLSVWHHRLGVPMSRSPLRFLSPFLQRRLEAQWPRVLRHADKVVVPSRMDAEFLAERFPAHAAKVACIHHGLSPSFASGNAPPPSPERLHRLLYVGQHAFFKGHSVLSLALARILRDHPRARCTWVTQASAHAVLRSAMPPDLAGRVDWLDWRPHDSLPALLDGHGVFLFPSLYEGAGKASLEAMSRGLLLVASDTGAMRDYVADSAGGGMLCPVGDHEAIARAVSSVFADPTAAVAAAARGQRYAQTKSWRLCAENLTAMYRSRAASTGMAPGVKPS